MTSRNPIKNNFKITIPKLILQKENSIISPRIIYKRENRETSFSTHKKLPNSQTFETPKHSGKVINLKSNAINQSFINSRKVEKKQETNYNNISGSTSMRRSSLSEDKYKTTNKLKQLLIRPNQLDSNRSNENTLKSPLQIFQIDYPY